MWDKMDEDKKAKMTEKLVEMGIGEEMIDERLLFVTQKIYFKLMKLRLILDEKGLEEAKAKAVIEKMVAKAMEKDLAKIKEWHEKHKEMEKGDCC